MACEVCNDLGYLGGDPRKKRFCPACERGRFLAWAEPTPKADRVASILRNMTAGYLSPETEGKE